MTVIAAQGAAIDVCFVNTASTKKAIPAKGRQERILDVVKQSKPIKLNAMASMSTRISVEVKAMGKKQKNARPETALPIRPARRPVSGPASLHVSVEIVAADTTVAASDIALPANSGEHPT